jgi:hypothetical protein
MEKFRHSERSIAVLSLMLLLLLLFERGIYSVCSGPSVCAAARSSLSHIKRGGLLTKKTELSIYADHCSMHAALPLLIMSPD